jgi:purine-nucleoside phosphorylase
MKKVLSAVVLSAAVVATAGQAFAFGNFELTQVYYDYANKVEMALDLGTFNEASDFTRTNVVLKSSFDYVARANAYGYSTPAFNLMYTGMYIDNIVTTNDSIWDVYFVTTTNIAPSAPVPQKYSTFNNNANNLAGQYNTIDAADGTVDGVASRAWQDYSTYMTKMNTNHTPGFYSGMNTNFNKGEVTVQWMDDDIAELYLWHMQYNKTALTTSFIPGTYEGGSTSVITFNRTNGEVILNPVPVPAAAWLLGSGVLGLFGLRRRK